MRIDDRALDQFEFGALRHELVEQAQPTGETAWRGAAALARGFPRTFATGTANFLDSGGNTAKVTVPTSSTAVMLVRWDETIAREIKDGGVAVVLWDNLVWAITDREVYGRKKWLKLTLVSQNLNPGSQFEFDSNSDMNVSQRELLSFPASRRR